MIVLEHSIESKIDMIETLVKENNEMLKQLLTGTKKKKQVYTDEEIYNLKKSLSWKNLSIRTKLPISTLQYRYKRYLDT